MSKTTRELIKVLQNPRQVSLIALSRQNVFYVLVARMSEVLYVH